MYFVLLSVKQIASTVEEGPSVLPAALEGCLTLSFFLPPFSLKFVCVGKKLLLETHGRFAASADYRFRKGIVLGTA